MNHEELTKRRKELIDERAARLEEWRKLIQLEDRPPLAISLIGFFFNCCRYRHGIFGGTSKYL